MRSDLAHLFQSTTAPQPSHDCSLSQQQTITASLTQPPVFRENEGPKSTNVSNATCIKSSDYDYELDMAIATPSINRTVLLSHSYSLIILNIARLYTKTNPKYKVLYDV